VREGLLELLRCPRCGSEGDFGCSATARDEREIVSGVLVCTRCGHHAQIERGVVDLLPAPTPRIRREAAGLARFADVMRADGWDRDRVLMLPDDQLGYWKEQRRAIDRLLARMDPRPGERLLDVGANTCWASNIFAQRGLEVVAMDIATAEMQGLHTAEWFFDANGVFFERVLSSMGNPAIASGCLDYIFCSQVLHHNSRSELVRALRQFHRLLRSGGRLLVLGEPLRLLTDLKRDHAAEIAQFEGNEHIYFVAEYRLAASLAGFRCSIIPPQWPTFGDEPLDAPAGASALGRAKVRVQERLRRSSAGRTALLAKAELLGPDHNLSMICAKR
jgi:SAM-dependent methyltransferase/uncharacterized protein YbaR (Trm112 family)